MAREKETLARQIKTQILTVKEFKKDERLMKEVYRLDAERFGKESEDPMYLDSTTHVVTASDEEGGLLGGAAVILRTDVSESKQFRKTLKRICFGDKELFGKLASIGNLTAISNLVSRRHGAGEAILREMVREFKPSLITGYTRNERMAELLVEALDDQGFSVSLGGLTLNKPQSAAGYCYTETAAGLMKQDYGKMGADWFHLLEFDNGNWPLVVIQYPIGLKAGFQIKDDTTIVGRILSLVKEKESDPNKPLTLLFVCAALELDDSVEKILKENDNKLGFGFIGTG